MSEPAINRDFDDAQPVPVWTRPSHQRFAPVQPGSPRPGFSAWVDGAAEEQSPRPLDPGAQSLMEQGYALGLAEGKRAAEAALAQERAAMADLVRALEALQPEPPTALAAMLSATVRRLVAQIMGEVEIDADLLGERVQAIAVLIADETTPSRLRLNPADAARLQGLPIGVDVLPDPTLAPGAILLETGSGWIEDGPAIRLEKLRLALDRLGCPR